MSDVGSGLGFALSIAFIGNLGMLVYRAALASPLPSEVPAEVANAAMESVGGAVEAADGLPGMLQAVQSSFAFAIQSVYGIAAIDLFITMIIIVWKFRHVRQENSESAEDEEASL